MMDFYASLQPPLLPKGVEALLPFKEADVRLIMQTFYARYFADSHPRILLFGINPGRLGAGKTGIGFTDPIRLKEACGIDHHLDMLPEPSSVFIYDMINAFGGPEKFYSHFHFTSVSPIGYISKGLNANYYDTPELRQATHAFICQTIEKQLEMHVSREVAFCIGKGQNFKILKALNDEKYYFQRIESLPHPRWVMQYQYKNREQHKEHYLRLLGEALL